MKYKLLSVAFLFNGFLFSQNISVDTIYSLPNVKINENRLINTSPFKTNKSMDILTSKQIDFMPVRSAQEALQFVAGVEIQQRGPGGTQADIGIDGGTFDQTLILLNGFKMSDIQTGHHNMNLPFPMIAIQHVEIYKGAQSRMFGPGALTGAVNFKIGSKGQNGTKFHAYSGTNFKSDTINQYKYINSGIQLSHAFTSGKVNHLIAAAFESGSGYRYNSSFNRHQLFYNMDYAINDKNSIQFMAGGNYNQFGVNGFYVPPIRPDTFSRENNAQETVATLFTALQSTHQINKWHINPRVSLRMNYDEYIYIRQRPNFFKNKHQTDVTTFELHASRDFKKGTIGLGAESKYENINSNNLGLRYRNNHGVFAEYKYPLSAKSDITPGFYLNYNSDFGVNIFPSLDIDYRLTQRLKIYSHTGTAMRNPTYTDWYYRGPSNDGNPNLIPEQSYQSELGMKMHNKSLFLTAYVFHRQVDNLISWVRPDAFSRFKPENIIRTQTNGFNFSLRTNELLKTELFPIVFNASYTYLDASFDRNFIGESKYELNNLRHQLVSGLILKFHKNLYLSLNQRYVIQENGTEYLLLDARINTQLKKLNIYLDVNNIGNVTYTQIASIPLQGRWLTLGLKMDI
ncbi:MAG: TonB-dependent receptor [Bacteroidota bacterium]|nr:TonB-dependent receptor [Bacteroidota bacterium]